MYVYLQLKHGTVGGTGGPDPGAVGIAGQGQETEWHRPLCCVSWQSFIESFVKGTIQWQWQYLFQIAIP